MSHKSPLEAKIAEAGVIVWPATNDKLGAVAPSTVRRVGEYNSRRISRIPGILSYSRFVRGSFLIEGQ
jgi:hypothetical protein